MDLIIKQSFSLAGIRGMTQKMARVKHSVECVACCVQKSINCTTVFIIEEFTPYYSCTTSKINHKFMCVRHYYDKG